VGDKPTVVLVGPPAAGKSRLAKRVAKLLDVPLVDTDQVVVAAHGAIRDIFSRHGEAYFRNLERDAVIAALHGPGVVALGGGAVIDPDTRLDLASQRVALVTMSPEAAQSRISGDKRPLLKDGYASWASLLETRQPWYDEVAQVSFDTSAKSMDTLAMEMVQWLKESDDV